jgi:hypothetical protein
MARDQAAADCAEAVIDGKKIDRSENDRPAEPE